MYMCIYIYPESSKSMKYLVDFVVHCSSYKIVGKWTKTTDFT